MKASITALVAALLLSVPAFSQDEDLLNPPDIPMHRAVRESLTCTFEGIQLFKKENAKGGEDVNIVFLLSETPPAYFNYYDPDKKAIVFDFYDTRIGESIIDTIHASPITSSAVDSVRVDLNREVAGLEPDLRDIVRVSLYTPGDFEYDVREEENVITLSFSTNNPSTAEMTPEARLQHPKTAFYWQFPLALFAAGGLGFATYELLK